MTPRLRALLAHATALLCAAVALAVALVLATMEAG